MNFLSALEKLEFQKVLQLISRHCVTEGGKKMIDSLLPNDDLNWINTEGVLVNQAKEILIKTAYPPIEFLPDLNDTIGLSKIEGAIIDSKKILEILKLIIISRTLAVYLKNNFDIAPKLFEFSNKLFVDKLLEHYIQKIIDENGDVKDNASVKLAEIRNEIKIKKEDLIRSVNKIVKSLDEKNIVREDYLTLRDGRIVIPVKAEHKRHIRGFIHSESSTGQTVYIEPEETLELNNDIVSLSFAEKREIERLLKEITKRIGTVSFQLNDSLNAISSIDSIFARAKYSIEINGVFPDINNEKPFFIKDARHPLLLKKLGKRDTVPLNFNLKNKKIILITGPNTGGKTVVLKTIGLLVLMVQAGIHVPANSDSNFHLFKNVLLDVGDTQSIEDDLSTFSSHLLNINSILNNSDSSSLVLLDEIGTGTDPAEGSAIAAATLILLRNNNSTVFATTHHGGLKIIANDLEGFENAAMEFDSINLKPTYVFKQGIPGSSYAFEIAKRIGLNEEFLKLASQYLDKDKHKLEEFLIDIEAKSRMLEDKLKKAEIENARLAGLTKLYQENIEKLNKEKSAIIKKAKSDAEDYLKGINKKIEKVIKELVESKAKKEVIKESKNIIKEIKETNKNLFSEEDSHSDEEIKFKVGDYAAIKNTTTTGEILELNAEKKKAIIKVGSIKMQVNLNNLTYSKEEKQNIENNSHGYSITSAKMRIDIRGEKPEEAELEIIKFIDDAYMSGLERIEILHGKGTGALKRTVHDILKHHEKVKNYFFAPIEFGGEGITIAELN